jgi:hypothetical protein
LISLRYLKFALIAYLAGGVGLILMLPTHPEINLWLVALSIFCAVPFMSLVVTRLPVFRNFYRQHQSILDDGIRSANDRRAASPMAGLVTGGVIALTLLFLGVSDIVVPAFCGAVGAGVMSFYHEPP